MRRVLLPALLLLLPASSTAGEIYRNTVSGWRVELPPGWARMPSDQESVAAARFALARGLQFSAGFSAEGTGLAYPYVLAQFQPAPLDQASVEDLEKTFNLSSMREGLQKASLPTDPFRSVTIDPETHRIAVRLVIEAPDGTRVAGYAAGWPARDGIVWLYYYDLADRFDTSVRQFDAMVDSFAFDAGRAWVPAKKGIDWGSVAVKGLIGLVVGGGIAGAAVFGSRRKRSRRAAGYGSRSGRSPRGARSGSGGGRSRDGGRTPPPPSRGRRR